MRRHLPDTVVVFVFAFACLLRLSSCGNSFVNYRNKEKQILDDIIGGRYDSRIRPQGNFSHGEVDGPCLVRVNIFVRSISKIDDVQMEFSVQLTFREQWNDDRLQYDDMGGKIKSITLTDSKKIWMPDAFFANEKDGKFHEIIMPNVLLRIFPNGDVLYSIRISLRLSCPMNLKLFPLDRQVCSIIMISYGYTTEDLIFRWKEGDPVQVVKNLHLPRFALEKYDTTYCSSKTNTGEYSCLRVDLMFKREFSYYLIQIYIPCCMLVIVSWVSFWLDQNAVPARVSLGVTTLLTMATQTSGINASLPPVSYTKAIDVWTGVCLTFVFGALLEFALVNYACRSDQHREKMKQQRKQWEMEHAAALAEADHLEDGGTGFAMGRRIELSFVPSRTKYWLVDDRPLFKISSVDASVRDQKPLVRHNDIGVEKGRQCEVHMPPKQNCCRTWLARFPTRSKRIDVISRITFPLVFALFNLVYWSTYLLREDKVE